MKIYGDYSIGIILPHSVKEYEHDLQKKADNLLLSLDEKDCTRKEVMDYGSKVNMTRKLMEDFWEEKEFVHLRPALVSALTAVGGWREDFVYDEDSRIRSSAASMISEYDIDNSVFYLSIY